jgi:hypothetical protein
MSVHLSMVRFDDMGMVSEEYLGSLVEWDTVQEKAFILSRHRLDVVNLTKEVEPYSTDMVMASQHVVACHVKGEATVQGQTRTGMAFSFTKDDQMLYEAHGLTLTRITLANQAKLMSMLDDYISSHVGAFSRFKKYGLIVSIVRAKTCDITRGNRGQCAFSTTTKVVGVANASIDLTNLTLSAAASTVKNQCIGFHLRTFKLCWYDRKQIRDITLGASDETEAVGEGEELLDEESSPTQATGITQQRFARVSLDVDDPVRAWDKLENTGQF